MVDELTTIRETLDRLSSDDGSPEWAAHNQQELTRRLEKVVAMQERLAARIETPLPRLDEPIILLSVAGCALFLGFLLGGRAQRRRLRRDSRLRL